MFRLLLIGFRTAFDRLAGRAAAAVLLAAAVAAFATPVVGLGPGAPGAPKAPGARQNAAADAGPPLEGAFAEDFTLLDPPVPAPAEVFGGLDGRRLRLSDFAGQVVLVNFWATWCGPCVEEMPSLERLQARLGGAGLAVAAISIDRGGRDTVAAFAARHGLRHLGLYLDPTSALAQAFGVTGLPTSFLIDAEGRVVGGLRGAADWDSPAAEALIRYYLQRRAPSAPATDSAGLPRAADLSG